MPGSTTGEDSTLRGVGALSIRRKVVIGFLASALLVFLLTATSAIALKMALAVEREAVRQAEELVGVGLLRAALERRVASFRGYLLTGEPKFLDKLGQARADVVAYLRRLRQGATGTDAELLDAVERAGRGYEDAAAAGLSLLRAGASPQELGRYIERVTSPRRDALDAALVTFLSHKTQGLRQAEREAERRNLWASGLIVASGSGALLLLLALAVPVSRRLAAVYEIEHRERERAEEAEAEQRRIAEVQRVTLDSLPGPVAVLDADGVIVSVNEPWKRQGGENSLAGPAGGPGANYLDACDATAGTGPDSLAGAAAGVRSVLAGEAESFDLEYRSAVDGEERWFRLNASLLRQRGTRGAVVLHLDITPRKRAERALRDSEARKGAILETALEGIVTIDEAGKLVEFNPSAERIFGYSREEVIGRPMAELLIPPRMRDAHHAGLEQHLRTGETRILARRLEMPALRADGSEFPVELTITRIPTNPPFFTGFIRDISAAKAAERERAELLDREQAARAAAEASQRRSAFLAEASSVLASSLDYEATLRAVARLAVPGMADWCVVDVADSEGVLQRLAVAHADPAKIAVVQELQERYPEDPKSPYGAAEVFRSGNPQVLTEIPDLLLRAAARDDEHYRILSELGLESSLSVPLEARGRTIGVLTLVSSESGARYGPEDIAFARSLAHRASLAIDNSRLYQEAQAAVAARDDFLSIASHELKTPVATLQLLIQNLLRRLQADPSSVSPATASERLAAVDKQVLRLTKLINDLLDLSRITDGRMELELEPTDLVSIVRDVVARHEEDARRAHCTVSLAVDSSAEGVWDRMRLDQVVENLLSNAIKYGAGGPIEVRVDGDESVARLMVRDEGIGIPPEAQARIFQRFERAVSASDYSGFGLGLWIVHQIVSAHSGNLRVESEPGRGSAFHVELPRTLRAPETAAAPEARGYTDRFER